MTNPAYRVVLKSYFEGDNRALERFVRDRNNALCEINLVRARQELRKGNYEAALEILSTIAPDSDFTRAEVFILKASVHSYFSKWQIASEEARRALSSYALCEDERGLFIANYNLSVYYARTGEETKAAKHLHQSEAWMRTATQKSLVYRARACEFSARSEFALASEQIERGLALRGQIDPVDFAGLLSVAADIFFRAGDWGRTLNSLEEIAQSKVVRDKARVRFDLLVLRSLSRKESRLVPNVCPEGIRDNEEYALRWEVLSALQSGEAARAESAWAKLVSLFPLRFRPGFAAVTEADESMLFIQAIRSVQRKPHKTAAVQSIPGKAGKLHALLLRARSPLRKEDLIEQVWEQPYGPALDNRFYKLMSRLRNENGVEVEVVLNSYRLAR